MKNTNTKRVRMIKKYLIIILMFLVLVGCQNDNIPKPVDETDVNETSDHNLFPEEFSDATVLDNITIESMETQTIENGDYYFAANEVDVFNQNSAEGSISYSPQNMTMTLSFTLSEGVSCLGAMDGHKVYYTVDLKAKNMTDKKVEFWTGCDGETEYKFEYTNDQLVDFALGMYSTIKAKHQ